VRRLLVEKIPFLLPGLGVATVAVLAQEQACLPAAGRGDPGARVLVANQGDGDLTLGKTVLPTGLLPFYSYPTHVSLCLGNSACRPCDDSDGGGMLGDREAVRGFACRARRVRSGALAVLGIVQIGPAGDGRPLHPPAQRVAELLARGGGRRPVGQNRAKIRRSVMVLSAALVACDPRSLVSLFVLSASSSSPKRSILSHVTPDPWLYWRKQR